MLENICPEGEIKLAKTGEPRVEETWEDEEEEEKKEEEDKKVIDLGQQLNEQVGEQLCG